MNVVPVIAKADTLTIEERDSFKQRIKEDLHFHGINIYPTAYGAEDEEDAAVNAKIEVPSPCEHTHSEEKLLKYANLFLSTQMYVG